MLKYVYLENLKEDLENNASQNVIDFANELSRGWVDDDISDFAHSHEKVNREDYLDEYYNENVDKCTQKLRDVFGTMSVNNLLDGWNLSDIVYRVSAMCKCDEIVEIMEADKDTIKRLWVVNTLMADYDLILENTLDSVFEKLIDIDKFSDIDLLLDERIRQVSYSHLSVK